MALTVIDVGCATYGGDESIGPLVDEFHPDVLYGFDPQARKDSYTLDGTMVHIIRAAAALARGPVGFQPTGLGGHVDSDGPPVPGVNLPEFIDGIDGDLVVKLDCEMSEYALLSAMRNRDQDLRIQLLLVEWHCPWCRHGEWSHSEACMKPAGAANTWRTELEQAWRGEMKEWTR